MRHDLVVPKDEHILALAHTMRQADKDEVWAIGHFSPEDAIRMAIRGSEWSFAGIVGGDVLSIFGLGGRTLLDSVGVPWALVSEQATEHRTTFLKLSRVYLDRMKQDYSVLANLVDKRNIKAVEWLRWLGFDIMPTIEFGIERLPFHPFRMEV